MTEPDEPQIQRFSLYTIVIMVGLLLLVVLLQRGYQRGVRSQVAQVQWASPWDHLEERRRVDAEVLGTGACAEGQELCRIPIEDAMDLLVKNPDRLAPWSRTEGDP